jgi:two-component system chemotaxis response regulator CheY
VTVPGPLILIVDDDLDIRNTVAGILQDEGYQVAKAGNGQEALDYLNGPANPRPRLILLDMMMPIMDGATFREHQQRSPELAAIPVLAFTAFGNPADVTWAAGRLTKPLRLEALLTMIAKHAG